MELGQSLKIRIEENDKGFLQFSTTEAIHIARMNSAGLLDDAHVHKADEFGIVGATVGDPEFRKLRGLW